MTELAQQGRAVIEAAVTRLRRDFGARLVAAYEIGSLAHGGFDAVSDVDLALILDAPIAAADKQTIRAVAAAVAASGRPFSDRLSVFGSFSQVSPCGQSAFSPQARFAVTEQKPLPGLAGSSAAPTATLSCGSMRKRTSASGRRLPRLS